MQKRNNTWFKNRRILITGISGFIGSHLSKKLTSLGAHVYGISRTKSGKNILKANITNRRAIHEFIKNKKIEICYHLAGESLVESGRENPYKTFSTNIDGTLHILEAARNNNVKKTIIASSSHVYGKNKIPYYEGYTPRPSRPYETSKACIDLIVQSYASAFNLSVSIPRFVNIYGPGDYNFQRIIPNTIRHVLQNKNPQMWGGDAIRDYLFIEDAIDAYISLVLIDSDSKKNNRIFNFGSGSIISVKDLIEKIIELSGRKVTIKKTKSKREAEIRTQYVSFSKAQKLLHWNPKYSLDHGLQKTLQWYQEYFKKSKNI